MAGSCLALGSTAPVLAAPFDSSVMVGSAPLSIALGAGAFAVLAMLAVRKLGRDSKAARRAASEQIAGLRAQLDEYEALLSASRDITVLWAGQGGRPKVFGLGADLLPPGRRVDAILDLPVWLGDAEIARLAPAIEALRVRGQSFRLELRLADGRGVRVLGTALGTGAALRLVRSAEAVAAEPATPASALEEARAVLAGLDLPAFLRNADRHLVFTNPAYQALLQAEGRRPDPTAELLDTASRDRHLNAVLGAASPQQMELVLRNGTFDLVEFPLAEGTAGYLRPRPVALTPIGDGGAAALVAALSLPVAVFNARRELVAFNAPYADLWKLGDWVQAGLDERAILDRLRRDGALPSEPDYQGWRTHHLASYQLTGKRTETWHLPDGRTLQVTAAPAGLHGGVIYLFEDISRELELMSQNRALASVQRSTLNALSDAVAVFGTNGRLQLFNPRLSSLWYLPINFLDRNPHIDQLAMAAAEALPEDGATIWRDLKRAVIDLSPTRDDTSGRINRSDGRLIDYAVVRLPDGQKLMTFLDVTESANFSRVLKERNDALVTADRLKDAFVQNVSYELRSPLTNIIGFADLLASPEIGPLNDRQRAYTDYIRASSITLGVLIDNILDLATVDAGIAELRPEPQDIPELVEKARAGLAATFPETGGGTSVNLKVEIAPGLPEFVADGTRIVQVLYNLLSIAARFSQPGGEVRLAISGRHERILFVVEDDGSATAEEVRTQLLERQNEGLPGRERGAGLGLSIVRAFVNLHGGTLAIEPRAAGGSRVVVSLPRDASQASSAAE